MTTEQLRYFVGIAATGSFSKTAEINNVSQSSVSKQIHAFERELGAFLFDRSHRKATLTPVGMEVLPIAQGILRDLDSLVAHTRKHAETSPHTIRLLSLPIVSQYGIMEALHAFEADHSEASLSTREAEEAEILTALDGGDCDIAILRREMLVADSPYLVHNIASDTLCLFIHREHPLAKEKYVTPDMLSTIPLMLMPEHTGICQMSLRFLQDSGENMNIQQYARTETILSAVEAGKCGALLMKQVRKTFRIQQIKVVPLVPRMDSAIILAITQSGQRKPLCSQLCEYLL